VIAVQHIVGGNNVVKMDTGNYMIFCLLKLFSYRRKVIRFFDCFVDSFFLTKLKQKKSVIYIYIYIYSRR